MTRDELAKYADAMGLSLVESAKLKEFQTNTERLGALYEQLGQANKLGKRPLSPEIQSKETRQSVNPHTFGRSDITAAADANDIGGYKLDIREGEPTQVVPLTFLKTLLRESLLLREQAGQVAQMRREVEIINSGQTEVAAQASKRVVQTANPGEFYTPVFDYDGLRTDPRIIHNHDFMREPRFVAAYRRAVNGAGVDQKYYWRAHVALWCASLALSIDGDFVECGVWKGLLSTTIMSYLDWNSVGRRFYLFDTFRGIDESQLADEEILKGNIAHFRQEYQEDIYGHVVKNFAEFKNVDIIRGSVPETLSRANIDRVAYLSIDMNNSAPEISAATHFWDRLSPGAPILLDDYGFVTYEVQKKAFDVWAAERGVKILALPTGQGLIIKPSNVSVPASHKKQTLSAEKTIAKTKPETQTQQKVVSNDPPLASDPMDSSLSAAYWHAKGLTSRAGGDDDSAFTNFGRAVGLYPRYEPSMIELKKMAAECLASGKLAETEGDNPRALRLFVRAAEMDPSGDEAQRQRDRHVSLRGGADLTKMCFIFYDAERARRIHKEAYKRAIEYVSIGGIVGDILEFGVLGGWSSRIICETLNEVVNYASLHLFDSFEGLPEYESAVDRESYEIGGRNVWHDKMKFPDSFTAQFGGAHELHIRDRLSEIIRPERIILHKGFYSETLKNNLPLKTAIVHIDCDLYQSTVEVLEGLLRTESYQDGCVLLFDDWNCNRANPNYGERLALREFLASQNKYTATPWFTYGFNGAAWILHDTRV